MSDSIPPLAPGTDVASASTHPNRPTRVHREVLGLIGALATITYLDRVCFGAAAPQMAAELGLSGIADLKWAFTAFTLAYGLFEIPVGRLGDRWGPRGTLLRIVAWWSLFTAITGLVGLRVAGMTLGGIGTLIVVRFLFGAGEAGAYPILSRVVRNWFPVDRWESVQGFLWMSGRLAGGLTPLIWAILVSGTAWTAPLLPWRGAFFFFAAIGAVWCIVFALRFRDRPHLHPRVNALEAAWIGTTEQSQPHQQPIPWKRFFSSPTLWALCITYSLINYGWIFNITYFPGYLKERFALADDNAWGAILKGAPLWIGAIGCLIGGFAVNRLTSRLNDRRLARRIVGISAMSLCATCWLTVTWVDNLFVFCLLVSLAGFGVDLTLGACWATSQDLGGRHTAVTAACMNTVGTFGASAAGWLTGTIVQATVASAATAAQTAVPDLDPAMRHEATMAGFQTVFLTYAGVYVVAALGWMWIRPEREPTFD